MTIAIGINFGDYVLLAADTRVVYYNKVGQMTGVKHSVSFLAAANQVRN